jgi:hypothetical protein
VSSKPGAGHAATDFFRILNNSSWYLYFNSLANSAGQIVKVVTAKERFSRSLPVNSIMKQAHCVKGIVAGAGSENNPVRDFPEAVFSIESSDFGVIQSSPRHTVQLRLSRWLTPSRFAPSPVLWKPSTSR